MAKIITGKALIPRVSRNGVFYWPQELKKFDGKTVPLRLNHLRDGGVEIGRAIFKYDPNNNQVNYTAEITDEKAQKLIDNGTFKVSIGATTEDNGKDKICHPESGECFDSPIIGTPFELAVVTNPGIPDSTLEIVESTIVADVVEIIPYKINNGIFLDENPNTSDKTITENKDIMSDDKTKKVEDCGCKKTEQDGDVAPPAVDKCPEGQKMVDGQCIPVESVKEQECPPGQKWDGEKCIPEGDGAASEKKPIAITVKTEDISSKIAKEVKTVKESILSEIRQNWAPKSAPAPSNKGFVEESFDAKDLCRQVLETGHARLVLNKEDWFEHNVTEAVSTSGTIPGVAQRKEIAILVGAHTTVPIRQFVQFQAIETGKNTARFYKIDKADFAAITESTSTDITASTHNFTAIDVTCATRGLLQQVLKSELEDWPEVFMNTVKETIRMAAIEDEHRLIVQTMASTNNDFNNGTSALAAGFPAHIDGATGAFIPDIAGEDAAGEFLKEGFEFARQYLGQRGNQVVPGNSVAIISPRAFRSLLADPDIAPYIQQGDPSISQQGRMERYLGIDILVSNELLVQNNSYRNIIMIKGKAAALASQRDLEIEMAKEIRGQFVDVVGSHRIGVEEIDQTAYVIVSSKQD